LKPNDYRNGQEKANHNRFALTDYWTDFQKHKVLVCLGPTETCSCFSRMGTGQRYYWGLYVINSLWNIYFWQ